MLVPFQRKYLPFDDASSSAAIREWFNSEAGLTVVRSAVAKVESLLPNLFGYHLAIFADYIDRDLISSSRISHQIILSSEYEKDADRTLVTEHTALPLVENSIDVLILPHTLEFADDPHQVLREAERVLIGEGHILIISFNPWSLYGLWKALLGWRGGVPWRGKFISQNRIKDWLQLLGFDIESATKVGFRPPIKRPGINRRLEFLDQLGAFCWPLFGNVSILLAKKRVASITPLKASWETRRRLLGGGSVAEPTTRNHQNAERHEL